MASRLAALLATLVLAGIQTSLFASNAAGLLRARKWLPTKATIVSSGFSTTTRQEWSGAQAGVGARRTVTSSTLDTVVFTYTAAGQTYEASNPSFFERWTLGKNSPHYPEASVVPAFYDSDNPTQAVLVRAPDSGFFVCLGVTFYTLLLFVAGVLVFRRARKAEPLLGGLLVAATGLLIILGALISSTDRPIAHFIGIGAFGGMPVYFGAVIALSRWRQAPGWLSALVLVAGFIAVVAAVIAADG